MFKKKKSRRAETPILPPVSRTPVSRTSFKINERGTHDGEQFKMLQRKFPSLVPSLRGIVPASKSATMR